MTDLIGAVSAVCSGEDGRLFLGSQDGFHLHQFTCGTPFHDTLLERWRCTLEWRARQFAKRGIPYVFFLVPDAPSVHPEALPLQLRPNFRPPGEIFLEAMGDIPGVTFVYPLQAIRHAQGGLDVYRRKDSHWTSFGSYVAYRELMMAVSHLAPHRVVQPGDVRYTFRRSYGDLGSQMDPEQHEEIPIPSIAGPVPQTTFNAEGVGRQTAAETEADLGLQDSRALFFRDSFMTDLSPYLARSYQNLLTLGTTTRVMFDGVDIWQPTIVVSQVAERKLFYHGDDHQLDGFETIYHRDFRSHAGGRLLKAMLLRGQDAAAARDIITDDMEDMCADPMHAFAAALIMEGAGDIAAATRFIDDALQRRPDQPSFNALAARIALASSRMNDAARHAEFAANHAPYNGYFHELNAYCRMQRADVPGALEVVEAGLRDVTNHPNLWYWASVCHAALGQMQQAEAAIGCALILIPDDPAYVAQMQLVRRH